MLAALGVIAFGVGLCMIGFAVPTMDDIGIAVIIVGFVGAAVRLGDVVRWLSRD